MPEGAAQGGIASPDYSNVPGGFSDTGGARQISPQAAVTQAMQNGNWQVALAAQLQLDPRLRSYLAEREANPGGASSRQMESQLTPQSLQVLRGMDQAGYNPAPNGAANRKDPTWWENWGTAVLVGAGIATIGLATPYLAGAGGAAATGGGGGTLASTTIGTGMATLPTAATSGLVSGGIATGATVGTGAAAAGGLGTLGTIGNMLNAGGRMIGSASSAAGNDRLAQGSTQAQIANGVQNAYVTDAKLEQEERANAIKDAFRASYYASGTHSPYDVTPPMPSRNYLDGTVSPLEQQAMARLKTPPRFSSQTMPSPGQIYPDPNKVGQPGTLEQIGSWLGPGLQLAGMFLR